jgi:hypothetical protein
MTTMNRKTSVLSAIAVALSQLCFLAGLSARAWAFEPVPEIDPGSMASALLILSGGVLILTGRRVRK